MTSDIDWDAVAAMSPTVCAMRSAHIPLTRKNFIDDKYGNEVPDPWDEDAEMGLPIVSSGEISRQIMCLPTTGSA